jgi:16S rRNA processing protein RimM
VELYVPRERLPEIDDDDSYYHADLIGLRVETPDGHALGTVLAVRRHGGGDLLEIAPEIRGESVMLPFVGAFVREVDIDGGKIVADPPEGLFAEADAK